MLSVSQTVDLAARHYHAGRPQQAEELCRQVLETEPEHIDTLFLLGLLAHQSGNCSQAAHYFSEVVRLKADYAEAHNNLGAALRGQGKLDAAAASWRQALVLKPDYARAHNSLGMTLLEQGKLPEAVAVFQQAVRFEPENAEFHNNLGNALQRHTKLAEAVASYQRALSLKPDFAEAHNNLGIAFHEQGKFEEAIASLRECLRLKPSYAEGWTNLGTVRREQRKLLEAKPMVRSTIHYSYVLGNSWQMKQLTHQDRARLDAEKWVFMCNCVPTTWRLLGFRPSVWVFGDNQDESCLEELDRCLRALETDQLLQERVAHVLLGVERYAEIVKERAASSPLKDRIIIYARHDSDKLAPPARSLDEKLYHYGSTLTDLVNLAEIFNPGAEVRLCGCQWHTRFGHYYEDFGDDEPNPYIGPFTDYMWEGIAHLRASGINVVDANFQHGDVMPASLRLPKVRLFD